MTKLPYILLAGSALALGMPAAAQTNNDPYPSTYGTNSTYSGEAGMQNRIIQLEARFQAGIDSGAITSSEARPLRQQIRYLSQLERRYAANGLTQAERKDLQRRFRYTRQQLRAADPNNARYANYDSDSYDPYAADTSYGGASRYQQVSEVCRTQSGLKGILGSVFGQDKCLRVGERVTAANSLSAVPDPYRAEFPNTNAYTYRYVDGNVVQIETRTAVITNIYDVRLGG